jgi:CHAT domain-containing protein
VGHEKSRERAAVHYQNAINNFGDPDSRKRFAALKELGTLYFADREFRKAAAPLKDALEIGEQRLEHGGSMHSRRMAVRELEGLSKMLAYCYFREGQWSQAVLMLDRGKSRLLNESLKLRRLNIGTLPQELQVQAAALRDEIRGLEAKTYGGMGYIEDMRRLVTARAALQGILSAHGVGGLEVRSLADLSRHPRDTALVMPLTTEHGSALFIVAGELTELTEKHVVPLPEFTSAVLNRLLFDEATGWFAAYKKRNDVLGGAAQVFEESIERTCAALWGLLVQELHQRLRELAVTEIVFIPAGGLQFLPVHAVPVLRDGVQDVRFGDEVRIRTAPSANTLRILAATGMPVDVADRALVAGVGVYEEGEPLVNAEAEARAVAAQMAVEPLLNAAVTAEAIAAGARSATCIHLACHGTGWAEDANFARTWSPEPVLCFSTGGVSFGEIVGWDLTGVGLVTLSACDTGLVDFAKPWDEFEGITNVLLQAGAHAVVASLWSVDDESTGLLMAQFYQNVSVCKLAPAEALRNAQRWLRSSTHASLRTSYPQMYKGGDSDAPPGSRPFAHPYYWAPFFVVG